MNKIIALALMIFLTSSVFASSTCCSSQGGCGNKKTTQMQNDQEVIDEMLQLDLNALQRDKFRAMLIRHKMEGNKPLSIVREKMYNSLTSEQKKELENRLKNKTNI